MACLVNIRGLLGDVITCGTFIINSKFPNSRMSIFLQGKRLISYPFSHLVSTFHEQTASVVNHERQYPNFGSFRKLLDEGGRLKLINMTLKFKHDTHFDARHQQRWKLVSAIAISSQIQSNNNLHRPKTENSLGRDYSSRFSFFVETACQNGPLQVLSRLGNGPTFPADGIVRH